jgi:hypothetical protein
VLKATIVKASDLSADGEEIDVDMLCVGDFIKVKNG